MRLKLFAVPFVVLISACTLTQKRESPITLESHALLRDQQALLADHASRLDALSESQESLMGLLADMQTQMASINQQILVVRNSTAVADKKPAPQVQLKASVKRDELEDKAILGRVEYVWLDGIQHYLKARIDTGAKSSSLNAADIQPFERNGNPWVRFTVDIDDESISVEAPLKRHVRIRQASVGQLERRPVVELDVRLGEIVEKAEFTLTDRTEMLYPILLGRSFLKDIAVVDVAKKFTRRRDPRLTAQVSRQ